MPDGKTMAQLRTFAATLGKDSRAVEVDTRVHELVASHHRRIANGRGLCGPRDAALAAVAAYREETDRLLADRKTEQARLGETYEAPRSKCREVSRAANDIGDLCLAHPELLRDLDSPAREG